jgi:hypothetical protein
MKRNGTIVAEGNNNGKGPLVVLKPWVRWVATVLLVVLAAAHLVWPRVAIDAVFLGLLAFAAFISLFDVESIEWQGVKAKRREIARAQAALDDAPAVTGEGVPSPAPPPSQEAVATSEPNTAYTAGTVHSTPTNLDVPTNKFERLFWATEQIRIELIVLTGSSGRLERVAQWGDYGVPELIEYLRPANLLSPQLINAIITVVRMRNTAMHTQVADPASDLAVDVLQNLRSIHRYYTRVRDPDVLVYRDQSFTTLHAFRAVMVVQVDEVGKVQDPAVFPRKTEYVKGRFVTWSWDMQRVSDGEAWYKDPSTGRPKLAWGQAATFAGQEYPEQWGLKYRLPRPDLGLDSTTADD